MARKCTFNLMRNNLFRFVVELHCLCACDGVCHRISAPIRPETIKTSLFNASCAFAQNGYLSRHTSTAYIVRSELEVLQSRAELRHTNGSLFFSLWLRIGQIELFCTATIAIIATSIYHSVIFTLNRPGSWIEFHSIKVKMKMNE